MSKSWKLLSSDTALLKWTIGTIRKNLEKGKVNGILKKIIELYLAFTVWKLLQRNVYFGEKIKEFSF